MKPLISVVMPLRLTDNILPQCKRGLINQTVQDFEVIIEQSKNNAAINRNVGASKAEGKYLFFLDGDTELYPTALAELLSTLDGSSAGYSYSDFIMWGARQGQHVAGEFSAESLYRGRCMISAMSLIYRDVFCGFDESLPCFEDWDLWLTLLSKGIVGAYHNKPLFCAHYKHGDTSMQGRTGVIQERIQAKHGYCNPDN